MDVNMEGIKQRRDILTKYYGGVKAKDDVVTRDSIAMIAFLADYDFMLARIAELEDTASKTQAALRWALEHIIDPFISDSSGRWMCVECRTILRHAPTCPYDAADKLAHPEQEAKVTP